MKRMFLVGFVLVAMLVGGKPALAELGKLDTCFLGAKGSGELAEARLSELAAYAKLPRGDRSLDELVSLTQAAIMDAVICGAPGFALRQMVLPSLIVNARVAHAKDAVSIAENTNHPPSALINEAVSSVEAAHAAGADAATIAPLDARIAGVVRNRFK